MPMYYNDCVQYISSVEAYDSQDRSATADVYDFGEQVQIQEIDRAKAASLIESIEGLEGGTAQGASQAPEEQALGPKQKVPPQRVTGRAGEQAGKAVHAAGDLSKLMANTGAGAGRAVSELYAVAGRAGEKISKRVGSKGRKEKLVATELSLQDQINELEKIGLGLDGNAYGPEQISIIKTEILGLLKNRGKPPANEFQKGL